MTADRLLRKGRIVDDRQIGVTTSGDLAEKVRYLAIIGDGSGLSVVSRNGNSKF